MNSRHAAILTTLVGALFLLSSALAYPTVYPDGVTILEDGVAEGYVLFGARDGLVYLIDVEGNVVNTWAGPCGWRGPPRPRPGGHLMFNSCGDVMEFDWEGNIVWQVSSPEGAVFHHDFERLPNGNTLILCRQTITVPSISDKEILEDFLIEVDSSGEIVWEWHEADHFEEFGFSQERKDEIFERGGDWSHANAASPIPDNTFHTDPRFSPGNVVLSIRHQNTVAIIDRATDEVVWVSTDTVIGPHTTHMLPEDVPGGGNILVFDNGYRPDWLIVANRFYSRVVEIDPIDGSTPYVYTADLSGVPRETFFSHAASGMQRLSNGNTLIVEARTGRIFEVTASGQIVWEYVIPYRNAGNFNNTYRAYKVPLEWAAPFISIDLAVSVDAGTDVVQAGQDIDYTVQVRNIGSEPAANVELDTATPVGTTFQSFSAPAAWGCTTPAVGETGPITCTAATIGEGTTDIFSLVGKVDFCAADGTIVTKTATVTSDSSDATPGDNSMTIETGVTAVDCSAAENCMVGSCDAVGQQCVSDPLVCTAIDSCHDAGVCNLETGLCSNPALPDGSVCDDGDVTTCQETCTGGACEGGSVPEPGMINHTVALDRGDGATTISWEDPPGDYNVYWGTFDLAIPFSYDHICMNQAGPLSSPSITDPTFPAPNAGFYYLVTRVDQCRESISGEDSTGTPRPDPNPCPAAEPQ